MAIHQAEVQVKFEKDEDAQPLALEFERFIPVIGNPAGTAILRLYPAVKAELFASRGTVRAGSTKFEDHVSELVNFNQTNSANTDKIMDTSAVIKQSWVYDVTTSKRVYGAKFTAERGTTNIKCNQVVTGVILVTYKTQYKELEFVMEIEYTGYSPTNVTGSMIFHKGTVLAYYEGSTASLDITPPALTTPVAQDALELYRVTSNVLVTNEGSYEKPDEWPEKNTYTKYPGETGPSVGTPYVEHERVHEVGIVDEFGRYYNRTYFTPKRNPFHVNEVYKPPYEFRAGYSASSISDPSCAINYSTIITRLKTEYGFKDSDITSFGCFNR